MMKPVVSFAAIHKNIETRFNSASGGVFSAFAEAVLKQGGLVGGARYTEGCQVKMVLISDKKDLPVLQGAKRRMPACKEFNEEVKNALNAGNKVLVCATYCILHSLTKFLQKDYENLYLVQVTCDGVWSDESFSVVKAVLEKEEGSSVVSIQECNKEYGTNPANTRFCFENGHEKYLTMTEQVAMVQKEDISSFCHVSCAGCQPKDSIADICLSHYRSFWNLPGELSADLGATQISILTEKGKKLYDLASKSMVTYAVSDDSEKIEPFRWSEQEQDKLQMSFSDKIQAWRTFLGDIRLMHGLNFKYIWKNLKYNLFTKQIKTDILKGHYLLVDKNVVLDLYATSKIQIGGRVLLGHHRVKGSSYPTCIMVEDDATITFNGKWEMSCGSHIEVFHGGNLSFGNGYGNNVNLTILCAERIEIGDYVAFGRGVTISDTNGNHYIARRGYKNNHTISIGRHAWICEGCNLYGSAKIGEGAILGTRSVVASHVPAFAMVSGNPAQVIDEDVRWKY